MVKTYYEATIQDPVSGETTTLTAATEAELDRLIDARFSGESLGGVDA